MARCWHQQRGFHTEALSFANIKRERNGSWSPYTVPGSSRDSGIGRCKRHYGRLGAIRFSNGALGENGSTATRI